jgi:hypothetical protein
MVPQKGLNGINVTMKNSSIFFMKNVTLSVIIAVKNFLRRTKGATDSVLTIARRRVERRHVLTTLTENALNVEPYSQSIDTLKKEHALKNAPPHFLVKSVKEFPKGNVYCLNVPDAGAFAVENGVIVSNCDALRYLSMSNMVHAQKLRGDEDEEDDADNVISMAGRSKITGY